MLSLRTVEVVLLVVAGLGLVGCGQNGSTGTGNPPASLGGPPSKTEPSVPIKDLSERVGQTVTVEGEIVQQCPASGCWFFLKDATGKVFVELAPAKLNLKGNQVGQHVQVAGRVVKEDGQLQLEAQHVAFESGAKADAPSQGAEQKEEK